MTVAVVLLVVLLLFVVEVVLVSAAGSGAKATSHTGPAALMYRSMLDDADDLDDVDDFENFEEDDADDGNGDSSTPCRSAARPVYGAINRPPRSVCSPWLDCREETIVTASEVRGRAIA